MSKKITLSVDYEVEVRAKDGKLISREKRECKSLLKNFMLALYGLFDGNMTGAPCQIPDTGNVARNYPNQSGSNPVLEVDAPVSNAYYGTWVGSGDVAVTPTDYTLNAKIAHGNGGGQLSYGACTLEAVSVVALESRFRVIRPFTNNSGSSVTVKEIGCVFQAIHPSPTFDKYYLYLRDVLTSPQAVPDGATLTVRYRLKCTA